MTHLESRDPLSSLSSQPADGLRPEYEEEKGGGDNDNEGFVAIVGTSVQRPQRRREETEGQREDGGDSGRR